MHLIIERVTLVLVFPCRGHALPSPPSSFFCNFLLFPGAGPIGSESFRKISWSSEVLVSPVPNPPPGMIRER